MSGLDLFLGGERTREIDIDRDREREREYSSIKGNFYLKTAKTLTKAYICRGRRYKSLSSNVARAYFIWNDMWYGSQNWKNIVNLSICKGLHPKTWIWGANPYRLMNWPFFCSFEIYTIYHFIWNRPEQNLETSQKKLLIPPTPKYMDFITNIGLLCSCFEPKFEEIQTFQIDKKQL